MQLQVSVSLPILILFGVLLILLLLANTCKYDENENRIKYYNGGGGSIEFKRTLRGYTWSNGHTLVIAFLLLFFEPLLNNTLYQLQVRDSLIHTW